MNGEVTPQESSEEQYLDELLAQLSDPIHKRLIQAHRSTDPVKSMESELGNILLEVLHSED